MEGGRDHKVFMVDGESPTAEKESTTLSRLCHLDRFEARGLKQWSVFLSILLKAAIFFPSRRYQLVTPTWRK